MLLLQNCLNCGRGVILVTSDKLKRSSITKIKERKVSSKLAAKGTFLRSQTLVKIFDIAEILDKEPLNKKRTVSEMMFFFIKKKEAWQCR